MAIDEELDQPWARKHDDPAMPVVAKAARIVYPKSLEELIEVCRRRAPSDRIRAVGSHWSLSDAATDATVFVETHDPQGKHQALGQTLYGVVPACLNQDFIAELARRIVPPFDAPALAPDEVHLYPIHIESGKRVYQLYAELDRGDLGDYSLARHLANHMKNPSYMGPWAFPTLGNSGGQTVFGALTTGTHGGDFLIPSIGDAVMAIHLVADGGKHYWIEPESLGPVGLRLTDDVPLNALYGQDRYGGPNNFQILRNDALFESVLVSVGRFGIVYSFVIAAVPQYCLHQERRLTTWQEVKEQIRDPNSGLYKKAASPPAPSKFLQIAVCVTPHENFSKNLAGVTKRWNVPFAAIPGTNVPAGRPERRGDVLDIFDLTIQAPRFAFAGNSATYSPDPKRPGLAQAPSFLNRACANGDYMAGVLDTVIAEVDDFVKSNGAKAGVAIAAVTVAGAGTWLLALLPALALILPMLLALLALIRAGGAQRFGQVMDTVRNTLLNLPDPAERAAGIFVWHLIVFKVFSLQQENADFEAISYAVLDGHDYLERSCNINVDSIEVFFNAYSPMLIAYVDALLAFEIGQEVRDGKAFVGYISLRFTGPTRALIGQQRFERSCAVEVSGLRDAAGVTELIDFAIRLAHNNNFKGILHWGQRNESLRGHIQQRFGDTFAEQSGNLHTWRNALGMITQHGKLDGFSNAFTVRTGLEIVTPIIGSMNATGSTQSQSITVDWDCDLNPPATQITIELLAPNGTRSSFAVPLTGQLQLSVTESGLHTVSLFAAIDLLGERRDAIQRREVEIA